ncbi:MAG TPA: glycerophosphodiester phosphodiesterase [Pseudobdellovibrionaceae bacterium]|nr:glycerophosphodiester phosphodiesterase [Pseudobdellovibrionaceae bacterium]
MNPALLKWIHPEPWPNHSFEMPALQAHRGYWIGGFQENTLAAFRAAKVAGFRMCELDVRLSKDGVPVVFHDATLARFSGDDRKVDEFTFEELRNKAQAPSLRDVLSDAAVPEFFNIELKTKLGEVGRLEPAVAKVIREQRAENRVVFSSFNPLSLGALAQTLPEIPRALLVTPEKAEGNNFLLRHLLLAPFLRIHLLHLDRAMLNRKVCGELRRKGIPFAVWTVNEKPEARFFIDCGAKSIITDRVTTLS